MSSKALLACLGLILVTGCDRDGTDQLPNPEGDNIPVVTEVGEMRVLSPAEFDSMQAAPDQARWCSDADYRQAIQEERDRPDEFDTQAEGTWCYFGHLGPAEVGVRGGATYTFVAPVLEADADEEESRVCLVVDPEAVFWNQSIAASGPTPQYSYPDTEADDGDIDMFAGLSSYYTGSPGLELGDFVGLFTDSLGREIEIDYAECFQTGAQGQTDAHSGRATEEWCTVETAKHPGVEYTVVLDTFSVPYSDGAVSFGAVAVGGDCRSLRVNECTLHGEAIDAETSEVRECTRLLEDAYCDSNLLEFCCANPEMCGSNPPDGTCDQVVDAMQETDTPLEDPSLVSWRVRFCEVNREGGSVDGAVINGQYCCENEAEVYGE